MARFNICLVSINEFNQIYKDLCNVVQGALIDLGHECTVLENDLAIGSVNILIGSTIFASRYQNLKAKLESTPYLIYQLEHLSDDHGLLREWPEYWDLLKGAHSIWDFSLSSKFYLEKKGLQNVFYVPPGFQRSIDLFRPKINPDFDIVFIGSPIPRREEIIAALRSRGLKVVYIQKIFGEARNRVLANAKIILNIHAWEGRSCLETVRLSFLLANRCFVISEESEDNPYENGVVFASYDRLVEKCIEYAADELSEQRLEIARSGYIAAHKIDMADMLKETLARMEDVGLIKLNDSDGVLERSINTFDVFDTLIARRYFNSLPIWQHMEMESSLPGFAQARESADNGQRNIYEIYDELVKNSTISSQVRSALIDREIQLEVLNCFPVKKNLTLVKEGDLLISDMYLPSSAILQILRNSGLQKQVTLYQSNSDKASGLAWAKLAKLNHSLHLGDNPLSDYQMPRLAGINAKLFSPATEFTPIENDIFSQSLKNIAFLCREIRLRSDVQNQFENFFNLACDSNLPFLIIFCELLHRTSKGRNVVFLGRDCQSLHKIFTSFYGLAYYLPFSRKVAYQTPQIAVEYLKTYGPENALYVDISSTSATWEHLSNFAQFNILVGIYLKGISYKRAKAKPPNGFEFLISSDGDVVNPLMLEIMNCADHGQLIGIAEYADKVVRCSFGEHELPEMLINAVHTPIKAAVELSNLYCQKIRVELAGTSDAFLANLLAKLAIYISQQSILMNELPHYLDREVDYLKWLRQN